MVGVINFFLTFCSNWYNLKDGQLVAVAFLNTRGRPSSIGCDIKAHLHLFRFKNMSQVHISPSVYDKIKWPQSKLDLKILIRPVLITKTCVYVGNLPSDNKSLIANKKWSLALNFLRVTSWPKLRPPSVTVLKSFLDSQMVSFWPSKVLIKSMLITIILEFCNQGRLASADLMRWNGWFFIHHILYCKFYGPNDMVHLKYDFHWPINAFGF